MVVSLRKRGFAENGRSLESVQLARLAPGQPATPLKISRLAAKGKGANLARVAPSLNSAVSRKMEAKVARIANLLPKMGRAARVARMEKEARLLHKTKTTIKREASEALHHPPAGEESPLQDKRIALFAFAILDTIARTRTATFIILPLVGMLILAPAREVINASSCILRKQEPDQHASSSCSMAKLIASLPTRNSFGNEVVILMAQVTLEHIPCCT